MNQNLCFEACVDSIESALAAQAGGTRRIELCSDLLEGGLTPSYGTLKVARETLKIEIMVMIRPRGGDFLYSDFEFKGMQHEVAMAREAGADGVVFGLLNPDGTVDVTRTRDLIQRARPLKVTFHRAFDMTRDPFEALETLIGLGLDRVLTSGQEASVIEGLDLIAALIQRAQGRIVVMPGGGITAHNVARVAALPGLQEIHFGGGAPVESPMVFRNPRIFMGGVLRPPEYSRDIQQPTLAAEIISAALKGKTRP